MLALLCKQPITVNDKLLHSVIYVADKGLLIFACVLDNAMMPNFNSVTEVGHLTRDPETKFFADDKQVAKFGLAVSRKFGDKEEVLFIDVEVWGKLVDVVSKYLTKGSPVLVAGRLKMDQWEDKATGAKWSKIFIAADSIQLLGSKGDKAAPRQERSDSPPAYDEDMEPF